MPAPRENQPGRIGRFLGLKRVLAANVALFALIGWGFSGELMRNRDMQDEIDRLAARAAELETKNSDLEALGERMRDGALLEKQAREKLNLRRPGEEVVVVKEGMPKSALPADAVAARETRHGEPSSNVSRWWQYFFR
jgi:cell division protein FtsB